MALKDMPCTCCGEPSNRMVDGKPYCNRHGQQMKKYGYIKYEDRILHYGPHEIYKNEEENYYYMIIEGQICKFDEQDIEIAKSVRWQLGEGRLTKYVRAPRLKNGLYNRSGFHRVILGFPDCDIDHINGDGLDNRRSNLRLVEHYENIQNVPVMKHNQLGHKNISYNEKKGCYTIRVQVKGKRHSRDAKTLEEALIIRDEMYKEYNYKCYRQTDRKDDNDE